ncbi:hypothetical protein HA466_0014690 [Hirschfeldia incana]|nr:hypothetical protein HA466_0014690 [Hirschfeldia incana]
MAALATSIGEAGSSKILRFHLSHPLITESIEFPFDSSKCIFGPHDDRPCLISGERTSTLSPVKMASFHLHFKETKRFGKGIEERQR